MDVEEEEITAAKVFDEVVEGDFGGVADAMKHGFTGEKSADGDAVDAPDEFVVLPAFQAVSMSLFVKLSIGSEELARNPSGAAARAGNGAAFHDLMKGAVNCDLESAFANDFAKAVRDVELTEFENGARIGRPPGDGLDRPGEDTAAISEQKSRNR